MTIGERVRSLAALFRRRRISADIAAEWQFHMEAHAAALRDQGLSPSAARQEAVRAFGSQARWQERTWEALGIAWADDLWRDVRFALRLLWKDRAFTIAALTTLTVCLGSYTAAFAVVDHAVLRPLQIREPERVVTVYNSYTRAGSLHAGATAPDYTDRASLSVFESQALYRTRRANLTLAGSSQRVRTMQVTPSFFQVLGVSPRDGRVFDPSEAEPGKARVVIVSSGLEQQQFGAGTGLGREIRVDGELYTVVGVMPERFSFIDPRIQLWVPLVLTDRQKAQRFSNDFTYIARLKPGVPLARAQAAVDTLNASNLERYPETKPVLSAAGFHSVAAFLSNDLTRDVRAALYLLWAGAAAVVLIGCINVGCLVLARAWARRHEFATRTALGAGTARMVRQLVVEQLVLTVVSAMLGLLLGRAILDALGALGRSDVAQWTTVAIDAPVALTVVFVATVVGVILGCVPLAGGALAWRGIPTEGGRSTTHGFRFRALRRTLVATQVASAFVLVLVSLLLLNSFRTLLQADSGFDPRAVVTASISLPATSYNAEAAVRFIEDALHQLREAPGVQAAGATTSVPFDRAFTQDVMLPEGYRLAAEASLTAAYHSVITPGYLDAMRIPLKSGRFFDDRDTAGSQGVVIVDEKLARQFWPGRSPVGERMFAPSNPQDITAVTANTRWFTVVGVVGNATLRSIGEPDGIGAFYTVQPQLPRRDVTFAVRGSPDAGSILRRVVGGLDADIPVFDVQTMTARTEAALSQRRLSLQLAALFGIVALVLCGAGIYGVLAYVVSQRSNELAIRLALGAAPRAMGLAVVRESLLLCAAGLACGASIAVFAIVRVPVAGVTAVPPGFLAAVGALLVGVSLAACAIPAFRASRIDAAKALRT